MTEQWKLVEGFEDYEVSNMGEVRRVVQPLKPYINHAGYPQVVLYKNKKQHIKRINRLVAQAFIPNPLNLPQVNHLGEDKTDNRSSVLEWRSFAGHGRDKALRGQGGSGVHYDKTEGKWRATYYPETNKQKLIGQFKTKAEALAARHAAMETLKEVL
jgi:hypothetical protein